MTTADDTFDGFGEAALELYEGLSADNSKTYWQRHKATYETAVAQPMKALAAALEPEFGATKVFRPYRDLRFSADKRPYQEYASMSASDDGAGAGGAQSGSSAESVSRAGGESSTGAGPGAKRGAAGAQSGTRPGGHGGLYLSLSADGLTLAGGYHKPAKDRLQRFRSLQDDPALVAALDATLAALAAEGFPLSAGDPVKTAPRGWPRDHPRIDLLRRTSLVVMRTYEPGDWLFDVRCLDTVRRGWRTIAKWNAWLDEHVGSQGSA